LREGRKFGVAALLASQLLGDFGEVVIGNTALKVALTVEGLKDKRLAGQVLGVPAEELPAKPFEALILAGDSLVRARIAPYHELIEGRPCPREAPSSPGGGPSPQEPRGVSGTAGRPPDLRKLALRLASRGFTAVVAEACRLTPRLCTALVDAAIQLALCPTTAEIVSYNCLPDIQANLEARYGARQAAQALKALEEIIGGLAEASRRDALEYLKRLRGNEEVYLEIMRCPCSRPFREWVYRRVGSLPEAGALSLYLTLHALKGCIYHYDPDTYYNRLSESLRVAEELAQLRVSAEAVIQEAVRVGVASRLRWVTTSGYVHECIVGHGLDNIAYSALEAIPSVKRLLEKLGAEAQRALQEWDTKALRALLGLASPDEAPDPLRALLSPKVPPRMRLMLARARLEAEAWINMVLEAVDASIEEASRSMPSLKVDAQSSRHSRTYTIKSMGGGWKLYVIAGPAASGRATAQATPTIIVDPLAYRDECHTLPMDAILIIPTPRETIVCGEALDELVSVVSESIAGMLERLREAGPRA